MVLPSIHFIGYWYYHQYHSDINGTTIYPFHWLLVLPQMAIGMTMISIYAHMVLPQMALRCKWYNHGLILHAIGTTMNDIELQMVVPPMLSSASGATMKHNKLQMVVP